MRIHILSDLHLEFAPFEMNAVGADVLVLAGDVHTGQNGIKWILEAIPDRPVIYVLGNHEFYGQKMQKLVASIKDLAQGTNVHVLDNDRVEIGEVIFLGATLWTDFRLMSDPIVAGAVAQAGMNDFRRIRLLPNYQRFLPKDARALHAQSLEWLAQQMENAGGRKIVVVTHHAPSPQSIPPRFDRDPLNAAFTSKLDGFITGCSPALWIHGHIHYRSDYMIGATRIIANPRGYPSEPHTGFDPKFAIEI